MAIYTSSFNSYWSSIQTGCLAGIATCVSGLLTAGGWVQTSDTGQTASASFSFLPGTVNSTHGYQVWRMADSLQGTYPVFVKVEYGTGSVAQYPCMYITVGTGSNGAGTITGIVIARTQINSASNNVAAINSYIYGSATTSRVSFYVGPVAGTAYGLVLAIERSKDISNADSSDGVILYGAGSSSVSAYGSFSGLNRAASVAGVVNTGSLTDASDGFGNIAAFPIFPMSQYSVKNPSLGIRLYATANLPTFNILPINIRGTNHSYLTLSTASIGTLSYASNWSASSLLLLYE